MNEQPTVAPPDELAVPTPTSEVAEEKPAPRRRVTAARVTLRSLSRRQVVLTDAQGVGIYLPARASIALDPKRISATIRDQARSGLISLD